ncbi:ABC transporter ATP-binding protein [Micromonospora sp. DR5-3]|nr:ABC transporter ATP-binding protein [Micromonospora sp. MP36]MCW3820142.1 ABC transporter ATP-binding protein [Micromonospora sp. DR5-3]
MSAGIRLERVRKAYGQGPTQVVALDDVTLEFGPGTFTAVMGRSGSGKSTLLQCAAGLLTPSAGRIVVNGVDLSGLDEMALTELRRGHIGFVFQSFNLVSSLTAEQNVELPLRLAGRRPALDGVRHALAEVGLAHRATHRPGQMSGGEQQRVAIARALISRPTVLFADEPTGALDTKSGREVMQLLAGLVRREGCAVVMVTHDPVAAAAAQRVIFLADGRVVGELTEPDAASVAAKMADLEVSTR